MTQISKSLCWAAAFIGIALANRFGVIADGNTATMFAVLPALWVASGNLAGCSVRKPAA